MIYFDRRKKIDIPEGFFSIKGASSFGQLIGPIYERINSDKSVARALRIGNQHTNINGIAHGGVMMAFADVVMGTACYRLSGRPSVSVRLVTDFIASVRVGDWLEGVADVVKAGGSMVFCRGLLQVNDVTVMTMSGTYKMLKKPIED